MLLYTYKVGSAGFNDESFEDLCESLKVTLERSAGDNTIFGETIVYSLRIPEDVFGIIENFVEAAPNRIYFGKPQEL